MTNNATPALQINAYATTDETAAQAVEFVAYFPVGAEAERDAFLSLFPKSAGLRATVLIVPGEGRHPMVAGQAALRANGVNGGKNETGIKRYRSILRAAAKAGVEVSWGIPGRSFRTDYPTQQAFEEAIA